MQIRTAVDGLFSPVARHRLGKIILYVAILSFFLHLLLFLTHNYLQHQWRSPLDINAIFFDQFFTLLIMSDVLILLFSLFYTDDFPIIIRNSSYVISTILLKLSFSAESGMAQLFICAGVGFGVGMSAITYLYSKQYNTGKTLR